MGLSSRAVPAYFGRQVTLSSARCCSFFVPPPGPDLSPEKPHGLYTPQPAVDLVHEEPIKEVTAGVARCDGGGPLGHPKVYINLETVGDVKTCLYCGARFVRVDHEHPKTHAPKE